MRTLFFFAIFLIPVNLLAQDSLFSRAYYDAAWSVDSKYMSKSLNDGVVMVGRYQFNNSYILELDSLGNVLWYNMFDFTVNQNTADLDFVERTGDSAYYTSGRIYSDARNRWEAGLMRISNIGDTVWTRVYGLSSQSNCNGTAMAVIEDTNVILGWTLENDNRLFVMKLDKNANVIWSTELTGSDNIKIDRLVVANDSTIYVGEQNQTTMKARLIQFNGMGQENWTKEYGQSVIHDIGLAGNSVKMLSLNYPTGNLNLSHIDYSGNTLWQIEYIAQSMGWTDWETPTMLVMKDSSVIICNPDNTMSTAIKINYVGNPVDGAILEFVANGAVEATNGGLFLLGNGPIYGVKSFSDHFGIIRVDSAFNGVQCLQPYSEPTPFVPFYNVNNYVNTVSSGVNAYQTSFVVNGAQLDAVPGCVTFIGGLDEISNSILVYPNVSDGIVHFETTGSELFKLTIIDQLGREVLQVDNPSASLDTDLTGQSGMYHYIVTFVESGETSMGKIIVE